MTIFDGSQRENAQGPELTRMMVGIAEYQVTTSGDVLLTSGLGSCIGVALCDPGAGVCGLVHVMLPTAQDQEGRNPAKFADTGTEFLLTQLETAGADVDSIEAKLAGGSDMLEFSDTLSGIGERNVERVHEILQGHDVPIVAEDVGGHHSRSVELKASSWNYVVKRANKGSKTL